MVHNKILIDENIQKRGIAGPSRCALCMASEESIQHLFFECPLSIQIWDLMISPLRSLFPSPSNLNDMFVHWKQIYVGSFNKKLLFANLWRWTPNFISWGIWLARNKAIFENKYLPPHWILAQVFGLLLEGFTIQNKLLVNKAPLIDSENIWITSILGNRPAICTHPMSTHFKWKLRFSNQDFLQ
jgi:hypothetical protein